ncbi:MAG TPA: S8 family serine peptidase [Solirubrobacteraceae bacterium]
MIAALAAAATLFCTASASAALSLHLQLTRAVAAAHSQPRYAPGVVLVGFHAGVPAGRRRALERMAGVRSARVLGVTAERSAASRRLKARIGPSFVLHVAPGRVRRTVAWLRARRSWVRYAEPDYLLTASAATRIPNDPDFPLQWGPLNTGQSVNGTSGVAGADDGAARAWAHSTGSQSIVIGEVDTGVDYTHPDLAANIWSNPGGIGGCPAGTHGYNVVASSCAPMDDDAVYGGHGTHVAGIMGAVGNNGIGVAGMNWNTTLLPVKWLDSNAAGTTTQLISALNWLLAAKQAGVNVRVVNDSATFVGTAYSQALSDEIDALGANNILFVTAAGNTGDDNDDLAVRRYPCGYDRPTEICVTASDQVGSLPSWANYGAATVDLAAPGVNIYSTLRNHGYGYISGGSMASPQVAGAAALVLSVQSMSPAALKADILSNVDKVPALSGLVRTGGGLDVCAAMPGCATTPSRPVKTGAPVISGVAQSGAVLSASTGSWSGSPTSFAYRWSRCSATGSGCVAISGATGSRYTVALGDVGFTLRVAVTATNSAGSASASSAPTAVVKPGASSLGYASVGSSTDTFLADRKRVSVYSFTGSASMSRLSVYLAPAGSPGQADVKGVVYADSAGAPGALLGTTAQVVYPAGGAAGWYALNFATPLRLAGGKYWIGVITGGSSGVAGFRYASVSGARDYNSDSYASGPSAQFGAVSVDSERMSLYATLS